MWSKEKGKKLKKQKVQGKNWKIEQKEKWYNKVSSDILHSS